MGHTILERNWRSGHLEIDIISFDKDGTHFVEVKTRSRSIQALSQEYVNKT
jgi:putative endonuclease